MINRIFDGIAYIGLHLEQIILAGLIVAVGVLLALLGYKNRTIHQLKVKLLEQKWTNEDVRFQELRAAGQMKVIKAKRKYEEELANYRNRTSPNDSPEGPESK